MYYFVDCVFRVNLLNTQMVRATGTVFSTDVLSCNK